MPSEIIKRLANKLRIESGLTLNHDLFWEHLARVAIADLRNPTAMVLAAGVIADRNPENGLLSVYETMIDKMLES